MYEDLAAAELFITMFYVLYSHSDGVLNYANGGHNRPLLYRTNDRGCGAIDAEGMVLGLFPDTSFDSELVSFLLVGLKYDDTGGPRPPVSKFNGLALKS